MPSRRGVAIVVTKTDPPYWRKKKTSMADEKLSLRWNNHPSAFISALNKFLDDETMCDLTLSAGAQSLKVHSLVLCACSSYFEVIFFLPFFAEYFQ